MYTYLSIPLYVSLYIYVYIYIVLFICIHIYIYVYICIGGQSPLLILAAPILTAAGGQTARVATRVGEPRVRGVSCPTRNRKSDNNMGSPTSSIFIELPIVNHIFLWMTGSCWFVPYFFCLY